MTTETLPIRPEDPFLEALQSKDPSSEEAQTWLVPIRQAGIAAYSQGGLPTTAHEDWRFTSLANLREVTFDLSLAPSTLSAMELESLPDPLQGKESIRLVLVDGQLDEGLSSRSLLPQGITLMSMKEAIQSHQTFIKAHLGQYTYGNDSPFAALNSALFCDGVYLHLPAGVELEIPIHIMHVTSGSSQGRVSLARSFFHLEQRASATVLETFCGPSKGAYLTSPTLECRVEDQAKLEHIKIQDESPEAFHMACVYASIDREAHFKSHYLSLGGKLSRNHIRTHLNGEGLCCTLNGLYLAQGHQVMDQHMVVDHAKPHTESHEYFNGILDDQARGVFHGRIHVRQIAQKTDAKQTNKNLLLSEEAIADTKPQLEIYADDVRCTHGATIGQLDEEAIWYLRSRGIPRATARRMLVHAFAGEIIDRIDHPCIRESLDQLIWDQLEKLPHFHTHTSTDPS